MNNKNIRSEYFDEKLKKNIREIIDYDFNFHQIEFYECLKKNKYVLKYINELNYELVASGCMHPMYGNTVVLAKNLDLISKQELSEIKLRMLKHGIDGLGQIEAEKAYNDYLLELENH